MMLHIVSWMKNDNMFWNVGLSIWKVILDGSAECIIEQQLHRLQHFTW